VIMGPATLVITLGLVFDVLVFILAASVALLPQRSLFVLFRRRGSVASLSGRRLTSIRTCAAVVAAWLAFNLVQELLRAHT
jgi:uncharacterized membrane protein